MENKKQKIIKSILIFIGLLFVVKVYFVNAALPNDLIYKTKGDYRNLVAVLLSEDGSKISAFPDRQIRSKNVYHPIELNQGYLTGGFVNGERTVFLDITYEEWFKSPEEEGLSPNLDNIKFQDPFLELYNCGSRYRGNIKELNVLIDQGKLKTECTPIIENKTFFNLNYLYLVIGSLFFILLVVLFYINSKKRKKQNTLK